MIEDKNEKRKKILSAKKTVLNEYKKILDYLYYNSNNKKMNIKKTNFEKVIDILTEEERNL